MGGVIGSILCGVFPEKILCFVSLDVVGPWSSPAKNTPEILRTSVERFSKKE